MKKYFITGTDTDVGKTFVTRLLLDKVKKENQQALAIKPVAAGDTNDATFFQNESSIALPFEVINPFLLSAPLSPHIAAKQEGIHLNVDLLCAACERVYAYPVDYLFIEGAGGWQVPINATQTMADVAQQLNLPVIIVVAMRLGCLNHALLTAESILNAGLPIAGFIANQVQAQAQDAFKDNLDTLKARMRAPLLGVIPYSINKEITCKSHCVTLP